MNQPKLDQLRRCLMNDLCGVEIEEHADLQGFIIRDCRPDWSGKHPALYTAYVAEHGYSAYIAIPGDGLEIADEKPLAEKVSLFSAVSRIKSDHAQDHADHYPVFIPVGSRTNYTDYQNYLRNQQ